MSDLIGRTIGQYQIIELIEDADTTVMYKGFQPNMNRYVAIEVLKTKDPAVIEAYARQNELLAKIQHPNVLPVIDSGQTEGRAYRVLQYVEGGLLRDHLSDFYDPYRAAGLISGIVAGLEKIHAGGYVHGSLEPDNIYLDEDGGPLLTDFGLPRAPGARLTPTMSPEQIQGGIVDRRTDVYSLGVLLYEILIGELPPPGVVVSPRAKRPELPESVEKVIFKAMAQNPDARFQSAQEFQNAFSDALQPVVPPQATASQSQAAPQPSAPPPTKPRRTNTAAIILGVVVVVVICGGMALLFSWWNSQDSGDVGLEPTSTPVEIVPTEEPEPTQAPEEPTSEPEPTEPPELPEVCGSIGIAGGFFMLGCVLTIRNNRHSRRIRFTQSQEGNR